MLQAPPWVVKVGSPQVDVSGFALAMLAGLVLGVKLHILMKSLVHSMATIPPPTSLNALP